MQVLIGRLWEYQVAHGQEYSNGFTAMMLRSTWTLGRLLWWGRADKRATVPAERCASSGQAEREGRRWALSFRSLPDQLERSWPGILFHFCSCSNQRGVAPTHGAPPPRSITLRRSPPSHL